MTLTRTTSTVVALPRSPAPAVGTTALVGLACRAPSVHNTQPWRWRVEDDVVELYADPARLLGASDPSGRNLLISCGAALHHLRVAARAHGRAATVDRLPDPHRPDLLARVRLAPSEPSPSAARDLAALGARVTDRRRFTSWPVPDETLDRLAASGTGPGVEVVPLVDVARRHRLQLLFARARETQAGDPDVREEQSTWLAHSRYDGVPATAVPAGVRSRFGAPGVDGDEPLTGSDGVLVIGTATDTRADRLRAGEALSALWLRATTEQLSVVPLSQLVEVAETRNALRHEVLDGALHAQLVVRLGWQEIARSTLPRTPRRPVEDVLLP